MIWLIVIFPCGIQLSKVGITFWLQLEGLCEPFDCVIWPFFTVIVTETLPYRLASYVPPVNVPELPLEVCGASDLLGVGVGVGDEVGV